MKPRRLTLSPLNYALTAFLAVPACVVVLVLVAILLVVLAVVLGVALLGLAVAVLAAWLPLTFATYCATKKHRQIFGTMTVAPENNCPTSAQS